MYFIYIGVYIIYSYVNCVKMELSFFDCVCIMTMKSFFLSLSLVVCFNLLLILFSSSFSCCSLSPPLFYFGRVCVFAVCVLITRVFFLGVPVKIVGRSDRRMEPEDGGIGELCPISEFWNPFSVHSLNAPCRILYSSIL